MLINNNIDFPALGNAQVTEIIPGRLIMWVYGAVLMQPLLYSLNFWLLSGSIPLAFTGFMVGSFGIIVWMLYESGCFKSLNKRVHSGKMFNRCSDKIRLYYNNSYATARIFWLFAVPALPIIGIIIYTISYSVLFVAQMP